MLIAPIQALASQRSTGVEAQPRLRVFVETGGVLMDLSDYSLVVGVVDEQGDTTYPRLSHAKAFEFAQLAPGRYWLFVDVVRYDRVVRELSITPQLETMEEHVSLRWSQPQRFGGAITILGKPDGKLSWSGSGAEGRIALQLRPTSSSGADLATEWVVCAPESPIDGMRQEFPGGPIDFTLASSGPGRVLIRAPGHAPAGIDLDFAHVATLELRAFGLQPAMRVHARAVLPAELKFDAWSGAWEYASLADIGCGHRFWEHGGADSVLELGAEDYVLGARAKVAGEVWKTQRVALDPREQTELEVPMFRCVPLVLEPAPIHTIQEIDVLDEAGLLVQHGMTSVDVPYRLWLVPGSYKLLHRPEGGQGEFIVQPVNVGTEPVRVSLAL